MGYTVAENVVDSETQSRLIELCCQASEQNHARRRNHSLYGVRHLLTAVPDLCPLLTQSPFIDLARSVLGASARPVKGVFFDKTTDANWPVPWHQDVTITVKEACEVAGFEMRAVKGGIVHAMPPVEVSEQMLALRIHLDDAGADHGALRVIPGSHRHGRLDAAAVTAWIKENCEQVVTVKAGDVMLMRPLLLHASSPCQSPHHRRVVHVEYAATDLPGGLEWAG